jgi:hypothetical protein
MMLRNNSGTNALPGLKKNLASAKQAGMYSSIDYRVCDLQEWTVEPTNLEKPADDDLPFGSAPSSEMPWD